jgi:hypothetical protein
METDFIYSDRRNTNLPRAYFYLGSIPNQIDKRIGQNLPNLVESINHIPLLTSSSMEQYSNQEQNFSID